MVARVDLFTTTAVFVGMALSVGDHALDLFLRELGRAGDRDALLFARRLVARSRGQDSVGVDVEADLYLRQPARRRREAFKPEMAKRAVVARQFSLALQHVDVDGGLVIFGRRKDLGTARGNGRIALDQFGHHAAERLHAQAERRDVEQHYVFDLARQDARLNRRADRHDLVRIDRLVRFFAGGHTPHQRLNRRHARRAAHQYDLVDVAVGQLRVLERLFDRAYAAFDQVRRQLVELRARELHFEVLRPARVRRDERQADRGLGHARKFYLRLLGGFGQALQRLAVGPQIDALVAFELFGQPIHDTLVEIVAAQVRIAGRGLHLEDAFANFEDRDVERPADQVKDHHRLIALFVQPVGERGGRRLVDDAEHVKARDLARVLGGRALSVVEISRHGDDRVSHFFAEVLRSVVGQFA